MYKLNKKYSKLFTACLFLSGLFLSACKDNLAYLPETPKRSILTILKEDPDYSLLVEALERGNMAVLLNTYGSYTLFAPNNEAINKYLVAQGKSSVTDFSSGEWNAIIRNHTYALPYYAYNFIFGSLPTATAAGFYVAMDVSKGLDQVYLNDHILVTQTDIAATNGVIHTINGVLVPPTKTIWQVLQENPDFSIITQALRETGVYRLIDERYSETGKKSTIFVEPDTIFNQFDIHSYNDLKAKYGSRQGSSSPADADDSLNIFVKYHILPANKFVVDFRNEYLESAHEEDYIVFTINPEISLNPHKVNNVNVKTKLLSGFSNRIAENGLLHGVDRPFELFIPEATPLTISFVNDVGLWPTTGTLPFTTEEEQADFSWIKWTPAYARVDIVASSDLIYGGYAFRIYFVDPTYAVELTTPPIFKGTYKIGFSWLRVTGDAQLMQGYIDGKKMEGMINYQSARFPDNDHYIDANDVNGVWINNKSSKQRLHIATATFNKVESHVIRFECVTIGTGRTSSAPALDCIEFIPVNVD